VPAGGGCIRVFGRAAVPKKFNAETDVTLYRTEYILPVDFLFGGRSTESSPVEGMDYATFVNRTVPFESGWNPYGQGEEAVDQEKRGGGHWAKHKKCRPEDVEKIIKYLYSLKKIFKKLTTNIEILDLEDKDAVMEKQFNKKKRDGRREKNDDKRSARKGRNDRKRSGGENDEKRPRRSDRDEKQRGAKLADGCGTEENATVDGSTAGDAVVAGTETVVAAAPVAPPAEPAVDRLTTGKKVAHVLRRKRYHNFTPSVMAHEYLAFRRMDRMYHRETFLASQDENGGDVDGGRPFLVISFTGDLFLTGQVQGVVGLLIAVATGVIHEDILDCVFDEAYPHLVTAPFAPSTGICMGDVSYMTWEGKTDTALCPRPARRYSKGWNTDAVLLEVREWKRKVHRHAAREWFVEGSDANGRLQSERSWREQVLCPWAERARDQLQEYREWKVARTPKPAAEDAGSTGEVPPLGLMAQSLSLPPLASVDSGVPAVYARVLELLQAADGSKQWPSTTPKRRLVMVSDANAADGSKSLAAAHLAAKKAAKKPRDASASAYDRIEGQGGASGSFSVGYMPGVSCELPRGNTLFPELTKAAFELERALCPNRSPSSTIAINRNAQFRPHTDSGAGSGQSTSLIVGLGTYVGGELFVEGKKEDIRYNAIEFDGWKQRHWTNPFIGERFSLVWFTPLGCEEMRGIDLFT